MAPRIDLLDPEFWRGDPQEAFAWMREQKGLHRDSGFVAVVRHADVIAVERDDATFSSRGIYRVVPSPMEETMISHDNPRHLEQRRLVGPQLTPKAVNGRSDDTDALIDELVGAVVDGTEDRVEVIDAWAAQLPARTTARLLGLPEDRWTDLKSWSERQMRIDMRERDERIGADFYDSVREMFTFVAEEVPQRRGCPVPESFLDIWANASIGDEPMSPEVVFNEFGLFVSGGAETTRTAIAHGLRLFCDHPDQWEAMAADPSLVPNAVEEVLRHVTPLNNMHRLAVTDAEVNGQPVAAGERLMLVYPSANKDESVFEDAQRFDITRPNADKHVAFGNGTHFCVGAHVARSSLVGLFTRLSGSITDLRVVTEPDVEPNIFARAVRSFTLGFNRRERLGSGRSATPSAG